MLTTRSRRSFGLHVFDAVAAPRVPGALTPIFE
jgi:hypothetical protein